MAKTKTTEETKTAATKDPMANAPSYVKQEDQQVPQADSAMPFPTLKLLQQLSPELDEDDTKYLPNAQAGDIIITDGVNVKIIDGDIGISFSPLLVRKVWTEWIPRKQGGGFVAAYNSKEECEAAFTIGNEIVISIDYLIVSTDIADGGVLSPVLLQFNTPTKMGVARELQKYIAQYKTIYGVTYQLKKKKQANRAGQKFFNFQISPVGWTEKALYTQIEALKTEKETIFLPLMDESAF